MYSVSIYSDMDEVLIPLFIGEYEGGVGYDCISVGPYTYKENAGDPSIVYIEQIWPSDEYNPYNSISSYRTTFTFSINEGVVDYIYGDAYSKDYYQYSYFLNSEGSDYTLTDSAKVTEETKVFFVSKNGAVAGQGLGVDLTFMSGFALEGYDVEIKSDVNYSLDGDIYLLENATLQIVYNGESTEDVVSPYFIVPVSITTQSGSGSSSLSPTISSLLSVIPLLLTVGLVIGAIGFLRMKN